MPLPRSKPVVAIIGRPNVGKSTLFNRLMGKRLAIVHNQPGVTRDRHYGDTTTRGQPYTLIDTGGFDPEGDDDMQHGIRQQIEIAMEEADVVLCVLDAAAPPTSMDGAAMALLRRSDKPAIYLANKSDSDRIEAEGTDLYRLGMDELCFISALHGRGVSELERRLADQLEQLARDAGESDPIEADEPFGDEDETDDDDEEEEKSRAERQAAAARAELAVPRVAVVGRPNAGKSSLINRLLGEQRLLVDAAPGTTRDSIDTEVGRRGHNFVFVDTAGLRRKGKVASGRDTVEALSVIRGVRAIDRAHIVVLLCDAARGIEEQDAKILGLALDRGKGVVIGLNKVDLINREGARDATEQVRHTLAFASWVPVAKLSALTGRGTGKLLETVAKVARRYSARVTTGELNRFFENVLSTHTPPVRGGRAPRFYFITQARTAPPLFVVQTSHPDQVHFSYQRYVVNAIRKQFGFEGVPIRVRYRRPGRRQRKRK